MELVVLIDMLCVMLKTTYMKYILMKEETKVKLLELTDSKIVEFSKSVDEVRGYLKVTEILVQSNVEIEIEGIRKLLEYRMFICLLILDLSSAMRVYLKGTYKYECIFAARNIVVIVNEGYKKIYNFINVKGNGVCSDTNRRNSFWVKNIGRIIENDLPNLREQYNSLTDELDFYLKINSNLFKDERNLSIHYHDEPVVVYDMFLNLDIDEIFLKMIPFIQILNKMFDFTHQLTFNYNEKSDADSIIHTIIEDVILKLETLRNSENSISISELQACIRNSKNDLLMN